MILVTGAYGFIGSKFVKFLNSRGVVDIDVSDYLTNGKQYVNLKGCCFNQHVHPDDIDARLYERVFHFGAISDTTCWDGETVMKKNYTFTMQLISQCVQFGVPISYSSSASVYGNGDGPLNLYAYSKYLVDLEVEKFKSPLVQGFRYFNVYSTDDSEWHKGHQASPFYKFKQQALELGKISIFEGSEGFLRDFVHVDRVCEVQWAMALNGSPGIYDLGSGSQLSFLQVANQVAQEMAVGVETIPFPSHLKGCYQHNTLANMDFLEQLQVLRK